MRQRNHCPCSSPVGKPIVTSCATRDPRRDLVLREENKVDSKQTQNLAKYHAENQTLVGEKEAAANPSEYFKDQKNQKLVMNQAAEEETIMCKKLLSQNECGCRSWPRK